MWSTTVTVLRSIITVSVSVSGVRFDSFWSGDNLLHKHNKTLPQAIIIFMSTAEVFSSAKLWQFNDSCKRLMFCWQFLHASHLMLMNTACGELFNTAVRTRGIDFFSGTSHFKLHGRKNVKKPPAGNNAPLVISERDREDKP